MSPPGPRPARLPLCRHRPRVLSPAPAGGLAPCPTAAAARPILGHRRGFILRFRSILNSFIKLKWLLGDVNNYSFKKPGKTLKWPQLQGYAHQWPTPGEVGVGRLDQRLDDRVSQRPSHSPAGWPCQGLSPTPLLLSLCFP